MTWVEWVIVALIASSAMTTIWMTGKPRKPTTPGVALVAVLIDVTVIVGLMWTNGVFT